MAAFVPVPGCATTMRVLVHAPPNAPVVERGDVVVVHARGVVKETRRAFWSTKDPGQKPFEYTAGVGGVITGASRAASTRPTRRDPRAIRRAARARAIRDGRLTRDESNRRRLGPRLPRRARRRDARARHSRERGLRRARVSRVGDPARRRSAVRDRGVERARQVIDRVRLRQINPNQQKIESFRHVATRRDMR